MPSPRHWIPWLVVGPLLATMAVAAPTARHACARLSGLREPLEVAAGLNGVSAVDLRARLADVLAADLNEHGGDVRLALRTAGGGSKIEMLWGAGVICATAPDAVWERVSRMPQVAAVFDDPPRAAGEIDDSGPNKSVSPEAPLILMHAPELWGRGLTGEGVVIAHIDTGVDMTHPDLSNQIWTNPGEIPNNGIDDDGDGYVDDVRGWDFASNDNDPTDSSAHGTDTAGLIVGSGVGGKQTGIAPGAKLMVLRRGTTESAMWAASQYAIVKGAQIISQSVSWKWSFSPRPDYSSWRRQAETELAAGIIHVNSAGNSGDQLSTEPIPYNVATPANCPPPWLPAAQTPKAGVSSVIAVGDVDSRSLGIASVSPYGPSEWTDIKAHRDPAYPWAMPPNHQDYPTWDGSPGLGKPDLVAPGDGSQTTKMGGGYETFNGTSAATPRVAGLLALLKQAVPSATPADLTRALFETARDLGPSGRDLRFGLGMPIGDAAVNALGPALIVSVVKLTDAGSPRGDGDGSADAGEIDKLMVTLQATTSQPLNDVDLWLSASANVVVRDPYAHLAAIAGNASADADRPFVLEFPAGSCLQTAKLQLELRQGGQQRIETITLPVGTEAKTVLLADDFEVDRGFTVSGTASSGAWVRVAPVGTIKDGLQANPAGDHTADPGTLAYVTGNGPTDPDAADVDNGRTTLTSPLRDGRNFSRVEVSYARHSFGNDPVGEDHLLIEATGDGTNYKLLEEVDGAENFWRSRRIVLSDIVTPASQTRVRFHCEDLIADDTVEAGIDDFELAGFSLSCTPWTIPPQSASPVGNSLALAKRGTHLELTWRAPSQDGGIDPAHGYSVTRSPSAGSGFSEIGAPVQERWTILNGVSGAAGSIQFFLVASK